ncbi:MAG TPA: ADP-ribosylglycohydrolase family protein [Candidatus Methanoperedens sp.]|nr:ADP-ribosylglycohydrolase family protein [Candidatus Methanoperedens sp.]HLB71798.1 ADP-ribosylglycohydrolase family protein [Candidatus Methanoperedens sp.]
MIPSEALRIKYSGCMLGAAMGDAMGKQNEGMSRETILSRGYVKDYGMAASGSPGEKLRPGQYTDDTEQMLVLARSIIDCSGFDINDFSKKIAKWGAIMLSDPVKKSLLGPSSTGAIIRLNSGVRWEESGSDTPSCGSAMRVAPIGLFYGDLDEVESNAALSSVPTHRSKGAIAGAVAVAAGIRCAVLDMECSDIIRESCKRASRYDASLPEKIELSFENRHREPDMAFAQLGTSYMVYDVVPSALYCFSKHFESPEKALIEAVNAGGDTDSIACITGALCGALHGVYAFPERWIRGLENKELVENIAADLFEKSISRSSYF